MPPYLRPDWDPGLWVALFFASLSVFVVLRSLLSGKLIYAFSLITGKGERPPPKQQPAIVDLIEILSVYGLALIVLWAAFEVCVHLLNFLLSSFHGSEVIHSSERTLNPVFRLFGLQYVETSTDIIWLLAYFLGLLVWWFLVALSTYGHFEPPWMRYPK